MEKDLIVPATSSLIDKPLRTLSIRKQVCFIILKSTFTLIYWRLSIARIVEKTSPATIPLLISSNKLFQDWKRTIAIVLSSSLKLQKQYGYRLKTGATKVRRNSIFSSAFS